MATDRAALFAREVLTPLCDATAQLFRPVSFTKHDRLHVSLNQDGKKFVVEIYAVSAADPNTRGYPSYNAISQWLGRVPERKTVDQYHHKYEIGGTDFSALLISLWPAEQVIFDDSAKTMYDFLLMRLVRQAIVEKDKAIFKSEKRLPDGFQLVDNAEMPLAPFQRMAYHSCHGQEGAALFMQQGTGKTPVVIARICNEALELRDSVDPAIVRKAESLEAEARRTIAEKTKELRDRAQERADSKRKQLLDAANERCTHIGDELKKKLGVAIDEATEEVLGDDANKVGRVGKSAADVLVQNLISEQKRNLVENAKLEADTIEADLLKEAEVTAKKFAELLLAKVAEKGAELREAAKKPVTRMYRALIVAPKNVRVNWRNELTRFATVPGKVAVLRGGQLTRTKTLVEAFQPEDDCKWVAVICSYEAVKRSWAALRMIEWDLCVLDESHYIKSPNTDRTKMMLKLRELCKSRMCLTGTPVCNTLLDVFTQLEFLGEGLSGFNSWDAFRRYYGKWEGDKRRGEKLVGYKNVPLIQERLARLSFMITKDEAMPDLPEKMYDVVEVEMTDEQLEIYKLVQQKLVVEIEADLAELEEGKKTLTATNILTKMLRLAQVTSGFVVWDAQYDVETGDETKARQVDRFDPNPKIEQLVELVKESGENEKTLIWACWIQDIRTIAARLRVEGIDCVTYYGGTSEADREEAERRFNGDPKCKVFIGNPAAGGVGLNLLGFDYWNAERKLQTNTAHEIYFSQNWSPTARSQSEDRAHRRGTRTKVRITDLVVPGTIDEEIRERVLAKHHHAMQVQDVREIFNRLLKAAPEKNGD